MRRLVNFCWSLFKWGFALVVVAALAAGGYLYFFLDEEIRGYAERKLAGQYPQLDVSVGGARFVPGRGVTLFDVALAERPTALAPGSPGPLLHVDELQLAGRFEMQQFLEGEQVVDRLVVRRPRLTATRAADGRWSVERLLPLPTSGGSSPPVEIVNATLVIDDRTNAQSQPLALRNAHLKIARDQANPAGPFQLEGYAEESLAKRVNLAGVFDPATGGFDLSVGADRLGLSDELLFSLPFVHQQAPPSLDLHAVAALTVRVRRTGAGAPLEWTASSRVTEGLVAHPLLPRRLTDVSFTATCDHRGVVVRDLKGKCGVAEFTAACNRYGWAQAAPVEVRGRVTELPLDDELRAALPGSLKKLWRRFRPEGVVDVAGSLSFNGARWSADGTVDCRGLSCEDAEKFPYRLTDGQGTVRYYDEGQPSTGRVEVNLRGLAERRPVTIAAEFRGLLCPGEKPKPRPPGPAAPCPLGWVEVNAPKMKASPALLAALRPHPQAEKIAKALSPEGEFAARWKMTRDSESQLKPGMEIDLTATDASVNYDLFPYRLDHIRGQLLLRNGAWTFQNLQSREVNGPRVVTASGSLRTEAGRPVFRMELTAQAAALDDALRNALPVKQQEVWRQLRPEGRVSFTTDVTYVAGAGPPAINVALVPHERSVAIEPTFFPYRLERIDGRFVMDGRQLQITGARAEHGRTLLAGDGSWVEGEAGAWRFQLNRLHVDYLDADHDLRLAAPLALRRVIDTLQPEGSFGIHNGRVTFNYTPTNRRPLRTDWDVELDCHHADANLGVRVEGVCGSVRIAGVSDGVACEAYGELNLDTLFWNGIQLTNVRGPLWSGPDQCLLGRGVAERRAGAPPVEVTAQAYGGSVSLNSRVLTQGRTEYAMAIGLKDIDLQRFSGDYLRTPTPIAGRVDGQLTLNGAGSSIAALEGGGQIEVREADLYELPVMVALLKVLRNRVPDTTAFDSCVAEFTMQGKHLNFSTLNLLGDAVSLNGRGEASLDKDLNLIFHTIVGRSGPSLPVIRSLMGQASEQILRLRVLGTIDQPDIRREALPLVGNVLEQLRVDLQPRPLTQPADVPKAAALRRQTR